MEIYNLFINIIDETTIERQIKVIFFRIFEVHKALFIIEESLITINAND